MDPLKISRGSRSDFLQLWSITLWAKMPQFYSCAIPLLQPNTWSPPRQTLQMTIAWLKYSYFGNIYFFSPCRTDSDNFSFLPQTLDLVPSNVLAQMCAQIFFFFQKSPQWESTWNLIVIGNALGSCSGQHDCLLWQQGCSEKPSTCRLKSAQRVCEERFWPLLQRQLLSVCHNI